MRTSDAIALLAGKTTLKVNSTAYIRHQGRLARALKHGRLTEYRQLRQDGTPQRWPRWYSRAEVLALRQELERDGFTQAAATQRRAVKATIARGERAGLIVLSAAAEVANVGVAAGRKWTRQGRFGARKIDGLWFFERAQVAAYRRPAVARPPETVPCALCGEPFKMAASKARRAHEAAAKSGSAELLVFCSRCWATPGGRSLAHSRRVWRRGYSSPGRSSGLKAQWATGQRDRDKHRKRNRQAWRSPKKAVERAERSTQARYGHALSPRRRAELAGAALSRAQRDSRRSQATRQLEERVRALWKTDMTIEQIAGELDITPRYVRKIRTELALPPRSAGRRSKN